MKTTALRFVPVLLAVLCAAAALRAADPATPHPATAIKPGDTVVVTHDKAKFSLGPKVLAELAKGTEFRVTSVNGDWIGGTITVAGKPENGWVKSADLNLKPGLASAPVSRTAADATSRPAAKSPSGQEAILKKIDVSKSIDFYTADHCRKVGQLTGTSQKVGMAILFPIALAQEKDEAHKKAFRVAIDNITERMIASVIALTKDGDKEKAFLALFIPFEHYMKADGTFQREAFNSAFDSLTAEMIKKTQNILACKNGASEALGVLLVYSSFFVSEGGQYDKAAFAAALDGITADKIKAEMAKTKDSTPGAAFESLMKQCVKPTMGGTGAAPAGREVAGIGITRAVLAAGVVQRDVVIQPKPNGDLLWVEILITDPGPLPARLDAAAVKLKDSKGSEQPILGIGLGQRKDNKPFIDYFLGTPETVVATGPFGAKLFASLTTEGPNVGKVSIEIDGKKVNLTFEKVPSTICLLFAVPKGTAGVSVTNLFGKTLPVKLGEPQSTGVSGNVPAKHVEALRLLGAGQSAQVSRDTKLTVFTTQPILQAMEAAEAAAKAADPLAGHPISENLIDVMAKVSSINPDFVVTVFCADRPAEDKIVKIMGKTKSETSGFFREPAMPTPGRSLEPDLGPGVEREKTNPLRTYKPITWLTYDWLEFGVVEGEVRCIRANCRKYVDSQPGKPAKGGSSVASQPTWQNVRAVLQLKFDREFTPGSVFRIDPKEDKLIIKSGTIVFVCTAKNVKGNTRYRLRTAIPSKLPGGGEALAMTSPYSNVNGEWTATPVWPGSQNTVEIEFPVQLDGLDGQGEVYFFLDDGKGKVLSNIIAIKAGKQSAAEPGRKPDIRHSK